MQIDLDKESQLLYNSVSNILWELNPEAKKELEEIKTLICQNKYTEKHPSHEMLIEANIINPISDDEITDILKTKRLFKQAEDTVHLSIAPTTDCNFRCPYCYESIKKKDYMSDEVLNNIQDYLLSTPKNKHIDLNWIGGEPIMGFNKIKELSLVLKKNKYNYSNSIITNGYLLNEIIDDLDILNLTFIQVTIDGIGKKHNAMRPHKTDKDSFSKIIRNLELINKHKDGDLGVSIRVNIDKNNCRDFKDIYDYIHDKFPDFQIYPSPIREKNDNSGYHSCLFDRKGLNDYILEYKETYGDNLMSFFPDMNATLCMAENIHSYLIGPDGGLYKCWEDLGLNDRKVGVLDKNGINITNQNLISKYLSGVSPFEMEPCKECELLPQCLGSCTLKRMKKKFIDSSYDCCPHFKDNLESFLKIHYNDKIKTNCL